MYSLRIEASALASRWKLWAMAPSPTQPGGDHLEGDGPAEADVVGEVDDAHAPAPDHALDLVALVDDERGRVVAGEGAAVGAGDARGDGGLAARDADPGSDRSGPCVQPGRRVLRPDGRRRLKMIFFGHRLDARGYPPRLSRRNAPSPFTLSPPVFCPDRAARRSGCRPVPFHDTVQASSMASFQSKLARLPAMPGPLPPPLTLAGTQPRPAPAPAGERPSLDELRGPDRPDHRPRRAPAPRSEPSQGELPFLVEHTDRGVLYVRRERAVPAARVGRVPARGRAGRGRRPARAARARPVALGVRFGQALYLDTETTGLAGGTGTVPFLVGLSWYDAAAGVFVLEQTLLRRLGEEGPILDLVARRIEAASMLVTFNGKAFDMPLLRTRFVMNRLAAPREPPHLDLVHVARRIHRTRLRSRTLVAVEAEVLGRGRVDDVSGGDIVATYMHFLRTGDDAALLGVVEHNAADVLAMVALVGLYGERLDATYTPEHDVGAPPPGLDGTDLAGMARTLQRADALDLAADLAEAAVARGGGSEALRARGDIAKARGDKARALSDYEALAQEVDDPGVRLALCKLYEHHVRAFAAALALLDKGTGETGEAAARRKSRLTRKLARAGGAG